LRGGGDLSSKDTKESVRMKLHGGNWAIALDLEFSKKWGEESRIRGARAGSMCLKRFVVGGGTANGKPFELASPPVSNWNRGL